VTFEGRPVEAGTITFYPELGGRPAVGKIHSDGVYELTTYHQGDGALLGAHKIAIEAKQVTSTGVEPKSFAEELAQENASRRPPKTNVTWLVPQRYSSTESSGLTATIVSGNNDIDFALP
jgi:hypothetical protein